MSNIQKKKNIYKWNTIKDVLELKIEIEIKI